MATSATVDDASVLPAEDHHEVWAPHYNPWLIAFTVTLATFMESLDTSIANVALPHIAGTLSASVDESTWVLTSYLVSNAVVLPISGWMSNRIGRKRFYMSCVFLFTLTSFLCGLAPQTRRMHGQSQPSSSRRRCISGSRRKRERYFRLWRIALIEAVHY